MTSLKSTASTAQPVDNLDDEVRAWNTATKHRFPVSRSYEDISRPEQDAWSILYDEQIKQDGNMCEIWKDEIQSLLTFSGLFSAVLTGFLATTYTGLQPDPTDTTTFVLAQIAARLDASIGLANSSSITPLSLDPPFSPPQPLVRMHVFWFLSLITSLASAVVGISCLQWIRELQREDATLLVKDLFGLQSMRRAAFNKWRVPDIIASLPLLLQLSLVFFFIGMFDFLLPLGIAVATPTLVVIGFIFLFLVFTMVAPAFQTLFLLYRGYKEAVPLPCAFKSPQSWHFLINLRRIIPLLIAAFQTPGAVVRSIWARMRGEPYEERKRPLSGVASQKWAEASQRPGLDVLFMREWGTEAEWLKQRHRWFARGALDSDMDKFSIPLYDAARGLTHIIDHTSLSYTYPQVIYHCYDDLPFIFADKRFFARLNGIRDFDDFNAQIEEKRLLACWTFPSVELERTEYTVLLLNTLQATHQPGLNHVLLRHQLELYIRVLSGIFVGPWMKRNQHALDLSLEDNFVPSLLRLNSKYALSSITGADECIEQLALVFKGFLLNAMERGKTARLGKFHRAGDIQFLLKLAVGTLAAMLITFEENGTSPSAFTIQTLHRYSKIHELIRSFLIEDPSPDRIEIVLTAACSYIRLALVKIIFRSVDDLLSPPELYQEYITSFGLMFQQCDAVLLRLPFGFDERFKDAYDSERRLRYLQQFGLERLVRRVTSPVVPARNFGRPGSSSATMSSAPSPPPPGPPPLLSNPPSPPPTSSRSNSTPFPPKPKRSFPGLPPSGPPGPEKRRSREYNQNTYEPVPTSAPPTPGFHAHPEADPDPDPDADADADNRVVSAVQFSTPRVSTYYPEGVSLVDTPSSRPPTIQSSVRRSVVVSSLASDSSEPHLTIDIQPPPPEVPPKDRRKGRRWGSGDSGGGAKRRSTLESSSETASDGSGGGGGGKRSSLAGSLTYSPSGPS